MNSINASFPINNNNAGNHNSIESILERWTPKGKPNLNFLLNVNDTTNMQNIIGFLKKAEETTFFENKELREIIYKMLNDMNPIHNDHPHLVYRYNFINECRDVQNESFFKNLNFLMFAHEDFTLSLLPASEIKPSQIFILSLKYALRYAISDFLKRKYRLLDHIIPLETEMSHISADLAMKKMLGIPNDLVYLHVSEDFFCTEDKETIKKEVENQASYLITELLSFHKYITNLPEYKIEKEELFRYFIGTDNYELKLVQAEKRYGEELYKKQKEERDVKDLFDGIKNAAQE